MGRISNEVLKRPHCDLMKKSAMSPLGVKTVKQCTLAELTAIPFLNFKR